MFVMMVCFVMQFSIGVLGEVEAIKQMQNKGYSLIKQRYKNSEGEVDLIMLDDALKTIIFCEIKSTTQTLIDFENIISQKQWGRIINAAQMFFADEKYCKYAAYNMRFDAIFVQNGQVLKHIENIMF